MMDQEMTDQMPHEEASPFDAVISRVEGYIANPNSVTPETLTELLGELADLKAGVEGDYEEPAAEAAPEGGMAGLAGRMG